MITYSWKAEFNEDEKALIKVYRQVNSILSNPKHREKLLNVVIFAEMANALDRYEVILNELEKELDTITDLKEIKEILSTAKDIFYWGYKKTALIYDNGQLAKNNPLEGEWLYKPISGVEKIVFRKHLEAWEVIWKV